MDDRIIHPTAIVADGCKLAENVRIGPYCVLGSAVEIGNNTSLHSHIVIDGQTSIGSDCKIFPFASIGTVSQDKKHQSEISYVEIGNGTTIREYVTVNNATGAGNKTIVGKNCLLLALAHVAHNCVIGDNVILANSVALAGEVTIEDYAIIGGLSGAHQFTRIGKMAIVGGCSKVVQDILPYIIADGHPAVPRGLNKVGMSRNNVPEESQAALKQAYRLLFRASMNLNAAIKEIRNSVPHVPEVEHLVNFIKANIRGIARDASTK